MSELELNEKKGLKAALDDAVRTSDPVPGSDAAVEQLPLLPLRQVGAQFAGDDLAESGSGDGVPSSHRGPGRPKGAKNKNTEEWRNFLLSRYSSPLVALAETYSRPVQDLARDLGFIDKITGKVTATPQQMLDLFKVQLQCAKELSPYVHQKQPQAIDAGENGLMQLIINSGSATSEEVDDAGVMDLNFIEVENEENQGVSDSEKQKSVVCESVVHAQGIEYQEENGEIATDYVSVAKGDE